MLAFKNRQNFEKKGGTKTRFTQRHYLTARKREPATTAASRDTLRAIALPQHLLRKPSLKGRERDNSWKMRRSKQHNRLGPPQGTAVVRGRRSGRGGRPINPRNPHMTVGVICTHCGTKNHSAAQCWTLHPKLCPHPKRENVMMAKHEKSNMVAYRVWETEQQEREERCQRFEKERDRKELLRQEEEDAPMEGGNQQFMAARIEENLPKGIEYSDLFELDDPALEAELQLLEGPIYESPQELRRLQQSADEKGGVPKPEELVETWFKWTVKKDIPIKIKNIQPMLMRSKHDTVFQDRLWHQRYGTRWGYGSHRG